MSFVSYAQNFEDVMLWRALKHIPAGFYIDIGAQDPVIDSISLAFYEHDWRGCHVEPTLQYASKLRAARPDEMVLQVAVGEQEGLVSLYEINDTGLSTSVQSIAAAHHDRGFNFLETTVPMLTLDALLQKLGDRSVHWMKIDVEGGEHAVLKGWRDSDIRPWVLVIESTLPLSQVPSHQHWEPLVLAKGYEFVYFDGLNRFYISSEHPELKSAFQSPVNIFDEFVLSGTASQPFYQLVAAKAEKEKNKAFEQTQRAQEAEALVALLEQRLQQTETLATGLQQHTQKIEANVTELEPRVQRAEAKAQLDAARAEQAETRAAVAEAQRLEQHQQLAQLREEHNALLRTNHVHWMQANEHRAQLDALVKSRSWRITAPLRWINLQKKRLAQHGFRARLRALLKKLLRRLVAAINARPQLRMRLVNGVHRLGLYPRVRALYGRLQGRMESGAAPALNAQTAPHSGAPATVECHLSPRARQIYADLKAAIERRRKENG